VREHDSTPHEHPLSLSPYAMIVKINLQGLEAKKFRWGGWKLRVVRRGSKVDGIGPFLPQIPICLQLPGARENAGVVS